ncbi:hypothetical protein BS78_07G063300 [Paspalum vaginatum]|nr:hypothetical protein BS78_07G063300 [Paspalum vaginatum]
MLFSELDLSFGKAFAAKVRNLLKSNVVPRDGSPWSFDLIVAFGHYSSPSPRTIPWNLSAPPGSAPSDPLEKSIATPPHRGTSVGEDMAYQRVDLTPFIPLGLQWEDVPNRVQAIRVVSPRAPRRHEDVAIVRIDHMPGHQVHFGNVREIIQEYLIDARGIRIKEIQPSPLGQAYVRFYHAYDRDHLILTGPHQYIEDVVGPFARLLAWEDEPRRLAGVVVRVRAVDLETIPHFITFSVGEAFQGDSWTIQCEILQHQMMGGFAADEDPPPSPNHAGPGVPFDFFGYGQPRNGPALNQQQDQHQGQQQAQQPAQPQGVWPPWPNVNPAAGGINLNVLPEEEEVVLNLGVAVPEDVEAVIHPVPVALNNAVQHEAVLEINELIPQVIEEEIQNPEDEVDAELLNLNDPILEAEDPLMPNVQVELPQDEQINFNGPVLAAEVPLVQDDQMLVDDQNNFLVEEIPLDQLMDGYQSSDCSSNNIQVGMVRLQLPTIDPVFESFPTPNFTCNAEAVRLWAKFFAPHSSGISFSIPAEWSDFLTLLLMSPSSFGWASELIKSKAWDHMVTDNGHVQFSLPPASPSDKEWNCLASPVVDTSLEIPVTFETQDKERYERNAGKKTVKKVILFNSISGVRVRRSSRIQQMNKGFRKGACLDRNCLTCSASPPTISQLVIRNLGASFCNVKVDKLSDAALKGSIKSAPVGRKQKSKNAPDDQNADEAKKKSKK